MTAGTLHLTNVLVSVIKTQLRLKDMT